MLKPVGTGKQAPTIVPAVESKGINARQADYRKTIISDDSVNYAQEGNTLFPHIHQRGGCNSGEKGVWQRVSGMQWGGEEAG